MLSDHSSIIAASRNISRNHKRHSRWNIHQIVVKSTSKLAYIDRSKSTAPKWALKNYAGFTTFVYRRSDASEWTVFVGVGSKLRGRYTRCGLVTSMTIETILSGCNKKAATANSVQLYGCLCRNYYVCTIWYSKRTVDPKLAMFHRFGNAMHQRSIRDVCHKYRMGFEFAIYECESSNSFHCCI